MRSQCRMSRVVARATGVRPARPVLRLFPGWTFRNVHSWPEPSLPWTDKTAAFVISFDCETELDAALIPKVLELLGDRELHASFAVIGALVERSPDIYRQIVLEGHEVLNHGYSEHTAISPDGSYQSTLFYNDLSKAEVREEIARAHETILEVLGVACVGFRAPHFGTLLKYEQMRVLHTVLAESGYLYSSSTSSNTAQRLGLFGNGFGVREYPVAMTVAHPAIIFDSWNLIQAHGASYRSGALLTAWEALITQVVSSIPSLFVSVYLDPAHVAELPEFVDCLDRLVEIRETVWVGTFLQATGR